MLNETQKKAFINSLKKIIRESMFEDNFSATPYFYEDGDNKKDGEKHEKSDRETTSKRSIVMKWLATAQELHSVLAYQLYPSLTKDGARSEFSKKYRGEDDEHKPYEFDEVEINKLYQMRNDFIERGGLRQKA